MVALGLLSSFVLFICLFAREQKAAIVLEIAFAIIGYIACYQLTLYKKKSWFLWSILLSAPMLILGSLFSWNLIGGNDVKLDIIILLTSGVLVLISGLIGGYLGSLRKIKRDVKNSNSTHLET